VTRRFFPLLAMGAVVLALVVSPAGAAETDAARLLPTPQCGPGWVMEGKPVTYLPDDLYKHINGEAELYLPYGFRVLATVRYESKADKNRGFVVNLFKMGSVLDAFGIFSNYRGPGYDKPDLGTEAFVTESQLMCYQDYYFVQFGPSGEGDVDPADLLACGRLVVGNLPGDRRKPEELRYVATSGMEPGTEKYVAKGVLGYPFFTRAVMAEADLGGVPGRVLVILTDSKGAAVSALEEYLAHLTKAGREAQKEQTTRGVKVTARDPLYRGVLFQQSGPFIAGVTGLADPSKGQALLDQILQKLP
jgi:hypothetical protein